MNFGPGARFTMAGQPAIVRSEFSLSSGGASMLDLFGIDPNQVEFVGIVQQSLGLTGKDDYHSVIRKLGKPAAERERPGQGEMRYKVLDYPDRSIHIIVMGQERCV